MIRKVIAILVVICLVLVMCSCGKRTSAAEDAVASLRQTKSAAMQYSFDFKASIVQGTETVPILMHAEGDSYVLADPVKENWRYTIAVSALGSDSTRAFDLAYYEKDSVRSAAIRLKGAKEWTSLETVPASDVFFMSLLETAAKSALSTESQPNIYTGAIDGDDLRFLVEKTLNPEGVYDFSGIKWSGRNAPITITLDDSGKIASFAVDCAVMTEPICEVVTKRAGLSLNLDHFTIEVRYADFDAYADVDLPDIVIPGQGDLF